MKAQKWIYAHKFDGTPKETDLKLEEETLPALTDGDVLFEAVCLSVDPYMRVFTANLPTGSTMIGEQVAKVKESKHSDYKVGNHYLNDFGWRTHTLINITKATDEQLSKIKPLIDFSSLPPSLALGVLGMPGATAYFGLLDVCKAKTGDVVLVSGAAGAVGSVVGQIAKIKGCTVIGSAGSKEKMSWLKELGFDHVFNYKTENISEALEKAAPEGVDIYYDNVGGEFASTVVETHMKLFGRIVIVGGISGYNIRHKMQGPLLFPSILFKRLCIQGLITGDYPQERWNEAHSDMKQWIQEGRLKYREHVTSGFEKMPAAFFGLFKGENTGKAIVNV